MTGARDCWLARPSPVATASVMSTSSSRVRVSNARGVLCGSVTGVSSLSWNWTPTMSSSDQGLMTAVLCVMVRSSIGSLRPWPRVPVSASMIALRCPGSVVSTAMRPGGRTTSPGSVTYERSPTRPRATSHASVSWNSASGVLSRTVTRSACAASASAAGISASSGSSEKCASSTSCWRASSSSSAACACGATIPSASDVRRPTIVCSSRTPANGGVSSAAIPDGDGDASRRRLVLLSRTVVAIRTVRPLCPGERPCASNTGLSSSGAAILARGSSTRPKSAVEASARDKRGPLGGVASD